MDTFFKNPDLMGKLLPALATGLLAFIPAILSWMSNQAAARGRNGRVTQLAAELKLLEQWLSVSRSVHPAVPGEPGADALGVEAELDAILVDYRSLRAQAEVHRKQPDEVSPWARRLLLFKPLSFSGWLWSIGFWYLLVTLAFAMVGTAIDETTSAGDRVGTLLVETVIFGGLLYLIRRAALRLRDAQIAARQNAEAVPA